MLSFLTVSSVFPCLDHVFFIIIYQRFECVPWSRSCVLYHRLPTFRVCSLVQIMCSLSSFTNVSSVFPCLDHVFFIIIYQRFECVPWSRSCVLYHHLPTFRVCSLVQIMCSLSSFTNVSSVFPGPDHVFFIIVYHRFDCVPLSRSCVLYHHLPTFRVCSLVQIMCSLSSFIIVSSVFPCLDHVFFIIVHQRFDCVPLSRSCVLYHHLPTFRVCSLVQIMCSLSSFIVSSVFPCLDHVFFIIVYHRFDCVPLSRSCVLYHRLSSFRLCSLV